MPTLTLGTYIGNYEIQCLLHQSPLCTVYKCKSVYIAGNPVAVKILNAPVRHTDVHVRFQREFEAICRLDHPGVVGAIDAGWHEDYGGSRPYLAMQYVDGIGLHEYVSRSESPVETAVCLIRKLAHALSHIHANGILHRDLKPSNILVNQNGDPVILDFGIALFLPATSTNIERGTITGQAVGTPVYMSPEQMRGEDLDERSDIYTLGILAYELIGGQHPYRLEKVPVTQMSEYIRYQSPTPLSSLVPGACRSLNSIIGKAIEIDRNDRYDSAASFLHDLTRMHHGLPVSANSRMVKRNVSRWIRRHPFRSRIAAVCVGLLVILVYALNSTQYKTQSHNGAARTFEESYEDLADFQRLILRPDRGIPPDQHLMQVLPILESIENKIPLLKDPIARTTERSNLGRSLIENELYEWACLVYPTILSEHREHYGPHAPQTVLEALRYAKVLQLANRPSDADQVLAEVLAFADSPLYQSDHDLAGRMHYTQAFICTHQCRLTEALQAFEKAQSHFARLPDEVIPQRLRIHSLYTSARIQLSLGNHEEAMLFLSQALTLAKTGDFVEEQFILWIARGVDSMKSGQTPAASMSLTHGEEDPFYSFGTGLTDPVSHCQ